MACYLTKLVLAAAVATTTHTALDAPPLPTTALVLRSFIVCPPPGTAPTPRAGQGRRPEAAGTAPKRGARNARPLRATAPLNSTLATTRPSWETRYRPEAHDGRRRALMAEVNTAKRRSKKERGGAKSKMMAKRGDPARQVLSHLQEGGGSRQMRHCSASCTFLQSRSCCAWGLGRGDMTAQLFFPDFRSFILFRYFFYKRTRLYSRNAFRQVSPISLMMMCRSGLAN